jgi:CMP/dCMP kinase
MQTVPAKARCRLLQFKSTVPGRSARVERRVKEMYEKTPNITIEEVKNNLEMRDYIDSNREVSPLRKAADAVELDNTELDMERQLAFVLDLAIKKIS